MTNPFEPPLTLAFAEEQVEKLRTERRTRLAAVPDRIGSVGSPLAYLERQGIHVEVNGKADSLRSTVLYMMAWHRIEGDVAEIARALGKLAEL